VAALGPGSALGSRLECSVLARDVAQELPVRRYAGTRAARAAAICAEVGKFRISLLGGEVLALATGLLQQSERLKIAG
jgi:hypothetical protein